MDDSDDYIYCTLCSFREKVGRKDNFDRHMKQTHFGIRSTCDCGAKLKSSSLSRHKKKSCPLRKRCASNERSVTGSIVSKKICECGIEMRASSIGRHKKNNCRLRNQTIIESSNIPSASASSDSNDSGVGHGNLVSTIEHKIDTIVHIETYSNGSVVVRHGEIKLGNISFTINGRINDKSEGMIMNK